MNNMKLVRIGVVVILLAMSLSACTLLRVELGPSQAPLAEQTISGTGADKVLLIDISGFLMVGDPSLISTPFSAKENLVARLAEELALARKDKRIKAVFLRIDSAGGTVTASDLIYHQLSKYREETGVKIVACLMGVAASGGYYSALAADEIVALPTTMTGSIGVISLKLNLAGLMDKLGVQTDTIKSAPLKDMWSPFKPASAEERRIMQSLIDELFGRFRGLVKERRPKMTEPQLKQAATARVFSARQALDLGLVDAIGYPEEALDRAKKLAGIDDARLVAYKRAGSGPANIYAQSLTEPASGLQQLLSLGAAPRMMYLWLPGMDTGLY